MSIARSTLLASLALSTLIGCDTTPETEAARLDLQGTEAYMDQEVLVAIDDGDDGVARMLLTDDFALQELEHNATLGVSRMRIEGDMDVRRMTDALGDDHRVVFAEPNFIATASASDPYRSYQWNLDAIDNDAALSYGDGSGTVVAVLDTGVRDGGRDGLTNLLDGYDFYYGDSDPTDNDGHGTFVAGTIAQSTGNNTGVAGVAPGAAILPVKVLSDQGYGDINAISNGIVWAAEQGADVINMSLGSASSSRTMERAVEYAYGAGVVLVAATGNEYSSRVSYPAAYPEVIAVGATRYDGSRAGYSNTGDGIDLMAPGGDMSRDDNGDGYADGVLQETIENGRWTYTFWEGTSMATPHVAAAAALVIAQGDYSPADVADILVSTATDLSASGWDSATGYGLLNTGAAVALAAGGDVPETTDPDPVDTGETDSGSDGGSDTTDTTAPVISDVTGWTQGNSFTVQWVTDEAADTYIDFTDYGVYGDDTLTTQHTLRFNASRGMTLTFDLMSTDAAGNTSTSGPWQITL